jgi:hypothetical protein
MTRILFMVLTAALLLTGALPTPITSPTTAEARLGGGTR